MLLAHTDPQEAYRLSEFDARIEGAKPADLVTFCLGQVIQGIGSALAAHERGHLAMRSKSLTRALTGLTALEMGVDREAPLADALLHIYGAARHVLLDCVLQFSPSELKVVRGDFSDILKALTASA